jgi:hypothetical protein
MNKIIIILLLSVTNSTFAQIKKGGDPVNDNTLTNEQLKDFFERTKQIVKEFESYIPIVADKTRSDYDRDAAIEAAENLFSKGSTIQVSSKFSKDKKTFTIGNYLRILKTTLRYSQIKITFYDVARISEFIKDPDGNYRGSATIFQQFQGFDNNGSIKYQDQTKKEIATAISPEEDVFYQEKRWKVLLGNITVEETKDVTNN